MANSITLFKRYVPLLDEVYKLASLSSVLDGANELVREGANANELVIPKMSMQGLAPYSRNSGYVSGDVTLTNETVSCNFDRGRKFQIDVMDDEETMMLAFGKLASEFIRTRVAPHLDAFRFAQYASTSGIGTTTAADLTGATLVAALRAGVQAMDEAEVPDTERYLFITPTLLGALEDQDTTKSRKVLDRFAGVVKVPQTRFYTAITQYDGTTSGQEDGGYIKTASTGKNINFLIAHKSAVIQFDKHVSPKVIAPEANPDADAYIYGYRNLGIADVYENKVAGIYLHKATT